MTSWELMMHRFKWAMHGTMLDFRTNQYLMTLQIDKWALKGSSNNKMNKRSTGIFPREVESQIQVGQDGFRPGRGTEDQLYTLCRVLEGTWQLAQPVYMCFMDLEKAFDCVAWGVLWRVSRRPQGQPRARWRDSLLAGLGTPGRVAGEREV